MGKIVRMVLAGAVVLCFSPTSLFAAARVSHAVSEVIDSLTKKIVRDMKAQGRPWGRTALLVSIDDELDVDVRGYLLRQLEAQMAETRTAEVVQCFQCEALRGHSEGNQIVVEKGIPDKQTAASIARDLSLDTFLDVNVHYSGKKITLQAKAIAVGKQEIAWNKEYHAFLRSLEDRGLVINLAAGPAFILSATDTTDKAGMGIAAFIGERFHGVGKVGLSITSVFSVADPSFNQAYGPLFLANINELSGWYLSWGELGLFVNPSYSISQDTMGFLVRGGAQVTLGRFIHLGVELQQPVFSRDSTKKYPQSILMTVGYDLF